MGVGTGVGEDVSAVCRKCGEVWHVVIARTEDEIAKVECKECGGRHQYHPAEVASKPEKKAPVRKAAKKAKSSRTRSAAKPTVVEADLSRAPQAYHTGETYHTADRIVHPKLGEGVVQAIAGPTKIEVLFLDGSKILVHARSGGV